MRTLGEIRRKNIERTTKQQQRKRVAEFHRLSSLNSSGYFLPVHGEDLVIGNLIDKKNRWKNKRD